MYMWERFPLIARQPVEFPAVVNEGSDMADNSKKKITDTHKPRAWRWLNVKSLVYKSLLNVFDEENTFCSEHTYKFHKVCSLPRRSEYPTNKSSCIREHSA